MKEKMYPLVAALLLLFLGIPAMVGAQSCGQSALNQEFTSDPTARDYASCASDGVVTGPNNNDQCTLDLFNQPCTNHASCKVANILSREQILQTIIDPTDLETLARATAANDLARKSELDWLLTGLSWDMSKAHNQQLWKNVFPSSFTNTNTAINNAQLKDAPRSTIICHRPGTLADVSCGLRNEGCP